MRRKGIRHPQSIHRTQRDCQPFGNRLKEVRPIMCAVVQGFFGIMNDQGIRIVKCHGNSRLGTVAEADIRSHSGKLEFSRRSEVFCFAKGLKEILDRCRIIDDYLAIAQCVKLH